MTFDPRAPQDKNKEKERPDMKRPGQPGQGQGNRGEQPLNDRKDKPTPGGDIK